MRILSTKKRRETQAMIEEQDTVMSNLIKDKEQAQRAYSQEKQHNIHLGDQIQENYTIIEMLEQEIINLKAANVQMSDTE